MAPVRSIAFGYALWRPGWRLWAEDMSASQGPCASAAGTAFGPRSVDRGLASGQLPRRASEVSTSRIGRLSVGAVGRRGRRAGGAADAVDVGAVVEREVMSALSAPSCRPLSASTAPDLAQSSRRPRARRSRDGSTDIGPRDGEDRADDHRPGRQRINQHQPVPTSTNQHQRAAGADCRALRAQRPRAG